MFSSIYFLAKIEFCFFAYVFCQIAIYTIALCDTASYFYFILLYLPRSIVITYLHTFFGSSIQEKELSVRRTLIRFLTRNKAKTNKHSRALEYILALIRYFLVLYLSISLESTTTYSSGHQWFEKKAFVIKGRPFYKWKVKELVGSMYVLDRQSKNFLFYVGRTIFTLKRSKNPPNRYVTYPQTQQLLEVVAEKIFDSHYLIISKNIA